MKTPATQAIGASHMTNFEQILFIRSSEDSDDDDVEIVNIEQGSMTHSETGCQRAVRIVKTNACARNLAIAVMAAVATGGGWLMWRAAQYFLGNRETSQVSTTSLPPLTIPPPLNTTNSAITTTTATTAE